MAELSSWKLMLSRSRLATSLSPGLELENQITAETKLAIEQHPRTHPRHVVDHLLRNWHKMNMITGAVGAELVAILQPQAPAMRSGGLFAEFYSAMNYEIEQARKSGAPFYSFDRLLDDHPEYFYDEVHTYDEGHEIYAQRMLDLLVESSLIGSP